MTTQNRPDQQRRRSFRHRRVIRVVVAQVYDPTLLIAEIDLARENRRAAARRRIWRNWSLAQSSRARHARRAAARIVRF